MGFIEEYQCISSILPCFLLAFLFVGSLYIWNSPYNRDHPTVIKKRTISVLIVMIISPIITKYFIVDEKLSSLSIWELLGFRTEGLIPAIFIPLFLTNILFLGPLCMQGWSGMFNLFTEPMYYDSIWFRNFVTAPFSEEFTFRSCMLPLLFQCYKPMTAIYIAPLFFGLAHVHHIYERLRFGMPLKNVLLVTIFQFMYTTLFGTYSALLFVKTGHFIAPLLAHSYCNMMGVPNFHEVFQFKSFKKAFIIFLYILGVVLWLYFIPILTSHTIYSNNLYSKLQ